MGTVPFFRRNDPRIMAGGHVVRPNAVSIVEQSAKLEPRIADDARVGRPAGRVFPDEVIDDPGKLVLEVYA